MSADPGDAGLYPDRGGPTGGWSGSSTSRERAQHEEATGVRKARQREVYERLRLAGYLGLTDPEVQAALSVGHGASSGALTRLHRNGFIVRLAERRRRNAVYVLPGFVRGRPVEAYRPNQSSSVRGLEEAAEFAAAAAQRAREERQRVGPGASPTHAIYLSGKRDALVALAGELRLKAHEAAEAADRRTRGQ